MQLSIEGVLCSALPSEYANSCVYSYDVGYTSCRENTTRISGQLLDLWDIWDMRGLEPDDQAEQIVYCPILEDTGSTATSVNKQPALGVLIAGIDETAAVEAELAKDE